MPEMILELGSQLEDWEVRRMKISIAKLKEKKKTTTA